MKVSESVLTVYSQRGTMGTVADYPVPEAVRQYYADLDAAGAAAVQATPWWKSVRDQNELIVGWPSLTRPRAPATGIEGGALQLHRESAPLHFVMGRLSPFYIERAWKQDRSHTVW